LWFSFALEKFISFQTSQWLRIDVIDVNDNAPTFEDQVYRVIVEENTELTNLRVQAHDEDSGDNGRLRYSIIDGNLFNTHMVLLVYNIFLGKK